MTIILPQPAIPAGVTVIEAINRGILPLDVRVLNAGTGQPNNTLHALLSSGAVKHGTLASTLQYETRNGYCMYGGY
jgi:hypothetical protein